LEGWVSEDSVNPMLVSRQANGEEDSGGGNNTRKLTLSEPSFSDVGGNSLGQREM